MKTLWNREPAMFLAVIQAAIILFLAFGIHLTMEQTAALMAFSAALLGFITRSQVVPVEKIPTRTLTNIQEKDIKNS